MTTPPHALRISSATRRDLIAAVSIAFVRPLLVAAVTNQVREDYFRAFRCSRHLVEGLGLVYPSERVYAFTSQPLRSVARSRCC
jgi:hypothetical protein